MKKINLTENIHSASNEGIISFLQICEEYGVQTRFKLADRLEERGLTVRKCAELTGLRLGTISDLMNGKKSSVSFQHLWVLMLILGITDINDLIEFHLPTEIKDFFNAGSSTWIRTQETPQITIMASEIINGNEELIDDYESLLQDKIKKYKK